MLTWTFEELHAENEKNALGLQYTIAQRERYKKIIEMLGEMTNAKSAETVAQIVKALMRSNAEHAQDIFALIFNGGKRDGFFVEFGACDGVAVSNTLTLERDFAWRGILAEPDPLWHKSLFQNRTAQIDKRCVSSKSGDRLEFFQSNRPGNSSRDQDHPYLGKVVQSSVVETISLGDLLSQYNAPRSIDFLSVDTEGHEKDIFKDFDFGRYKFGFICVEEHEHVHEENSVQPLLEAAGYRVVIEREKGRPIPMQISGVDKFFIPK